MTVTEDILVWVSTLSADRTNLKKGLRKRAKSAHDNAYKVMKEILLPSIIKSTSFKRPIFSVFFDEVSDSEK